MAIQGRIIHIGAKAEGISKTKGTPWKKQEYVLETSGQYPKKVAFSIMNEKIDQAGIQIGHDVEIEVDAQSREYNGKWYTELMAWKIRNLTNPQPSQYPQSSGYQQSAPQGYSAPQYSQPAPQQNNNDDSIPF